MSGRTARRVFVAYLVAMAVFLLYPGIVPFNRIRPFIFGLPFVVVWVALWVALGFVVLLLVHRAIDAETEGTES